jgi:hypothetical protein
MSTFEATIGLVLLIALVALAMKVFSRDKETEAEPAVDDVDRLLAEVSGVDPRDASEVVAVDREGLAFVPDGNAVQLIPSEPSHEPGQSVSRLGPGDLIGARVRRGAPDLDPWRLEALGRDDDYRAWFFDAEAAARAALAVLERRVVRPARDEDGEMRIVTEQDYVEARRRDEETERALDTPDD